MRRIAEARALPERTGRPCSALVSWLSGSLGPRYRRWRQDRTGGRARSVFRHDTRAKVIVCAWVNDRSTLHSQGSRTEPYAVVAGMLLRGRPPDDWAARTTA
ncbi:MAG: type II toxin-antitoxin system YhaV family toxin [Chloroflexi bacterium]|nr:type II toxin-antitoxin system YhaV family toxin [Chloroflexota bacterium]